MAYDAGKGLDWSTDAAPVESDYTTIPPNEVLKSARFVNDAAEYYRERDGKEFASQEDVIEYFFKDRQWRNLNSISAGMDVANSFNDPDEQRLRLGRLQKVYENQPNFWNREGGWEEFATNILPAVLLDPVNLFGAGSGKMAATAAMTAAQRTAVRHGTQMLSEGALKKVGIKAAAKKGALVEGAVNAPIEAGFDVAGQVRDIQTGIQDEYDPTRTAIASGLGTLAGGALGGAFGAGGGIVANATKASRAGRKLGEGDIAIEENLAWDARDEELADEAAQTAQTAEEEMAAVADLPPLNPTPEEHLSKINEVESRLTEELQEVQSERGPTDPEVHETLVGHIDAIQRVKHYPEIRADAESKLADLDASSKEAGELRRAVIRENALYRAVLNAPDAATAREVIEQRAIDGAGTSKEKAPNETVRTEETDEVAPAAPEAAQVFDEPDTPKNLEITDEGLQKINDRALELAKTEPIDRVNSTLKSEFGDDGFRAWSEWYEKNPPTIKEAEVVERTETDNIDNVITDLQRERTNAVRRGDEKAVVTADERIAAAHRTRRASTIPTMPPKIETKAPRAAYLLNNGLDSEKIERRIMEARKTIPKGKGKQTRYRDSARQIIEQAFAERAAREFLQSAIARINDPDYEFNHDVIRAYTLADPEMAPMEHLVMDALREHIATDAVDFVDTLEGLAPDEMRIALDQRYGTGMTEVVESMFDLLSGRAEDIKANMSVTRWKNLRPDQRDHINGEVKKHADALRRLNPKIEDHVLDAEISRKREALKEELRIENAGLIPSRGSGAEDNPILSDEIVTDKEGNALINTEQLDPVTGEPMITLQRKTVTGRQVLTLPGGVKKLGKIQSAIKGARYRGVDGEYRYDGGYIGKRFEDAVEEVRSSYDGKEGSAIPVNADDVLKSSLPKRQKKFLAATLSNAQKELVKARAESTQIYATRLQLNDTPEAKTGTKVPYTVRVGDVVGLKQQGRAQAKVEMADGKVVDNAAAVEGQKVRTTEDTIQTADGYRASRNDALWYDPETGLFYHDRDFLGFEPGEVQQAKLEDLILEYGETGFNETGGPAAANTFLGKIDVLERSFNSEITNDEFALAVDNILKLESGLANDAARIDAVIAEFAETGDVQKLVQGFREANGEVQAVGKVEKIEVARENAVKNDGKPQGVGGLSDEDVVARFDKVADDNGLTGQELSGAMLGRGEKAHVALANMLKTKAKNPENFQRAAERYDRLTKGEAPSDEVLDPSMAPTVEYVSKDVPDTSKVVDINDLSKIKIPEGTFGEFDSTLRTAEDLYRTIQRAENATWPKDFNTLKEHTANLSTLYAAMELLVPQGVKLPNSSRRTAINRLDKFILKKHGVETIANTRDMLRRLGGDQSDAPTIRLADEDAYHAPTDVDNANSILLNPAGDGRGPIPDTIKLAHEIGHWAYTNILSNQDRLHFWGSLEKYFDDMGDFENIKGGIENMLPFIGTGLEVNAMHSPQEFFANQFSQWLMSHNKIAGGEVFWRKVARYVENIISNFTFKDNVDPDLIPLFEKILPDDPKRANTSFRMPDANEWDAKDPAQRIGMNVLTQLEVTRLELDAAMLTNNPDTILRALDEARRKLYGMLSDRNGKRVEFLYTAGKSKKANKKTHGPYARAMWAAQKRVSDKLTELQQKRGFSDEDALKHSHIDEEGLLVSDGEYAIPVADDQFDQHMMELTDLANEMFIGISEGQKASSLFLSGATKGKLDIVIRAPGRRKAKKDPVAAKVAKQTVKARAKKTKKARQQNVRNTNTATKGRSGKPTKAAKTAGTKSPKDYSSGVEIVRAWRAAGEKSQYGKDLMNEYVRRTLTEIDPVDVPPGDIPPELFTLSLDEMKTALGKLLEGEGNGKGIRVIMAAMQRRYSPTVARLDIKDGRVASLIKREADDSAGTSPQTGFPGGTRMNQAETAAWFTHRDKDIQATLQTLVYRTFNMMGRTLRNVTENTDFVDIADIQKIAGVPISPHARGVTVDLGNIPPEFNAVRGQLRRIAVGITKGTSSPMDLMHEVGHLALRTAIFDDADIGIMVEAFRNASDPLAKKIRADNPSKTIPHMAEEWFAEGWSQWVTGKIAKGDIPAIRDADGVFMEGGLQIKGKFSMMINRLTETVAYMVNGLLRRKSVRQMYRHMTLYGDMFEASRVTNNLVKAARAEEGGGVAPHMANIYKNNLLNRMAPERAKRVRAFVGARKDENLKKYLWFHGTPFGQVFDPAVNPMGSVYKSGTGLHGGGFYLTRAEALADAYSSTARVEQLRGALRRLEVSDENMAEGGYIINQLAGETGVIARISEITEEIEKVNWHASSGAQSSKNTDQVNVKATDPFGYQIEAPAERLVYLEKSLAESRDHEKALWEMLQKIGLDRQPETVPFFVNDSNIFNFDQRTTLTADSPSVREIVDELIHRDLADTDEILTAINNIEDGTDLYFSLIDYGMRGDNMEVKQAQLRETLEALGYDGIRTSETAPYNEAMPEESLVIWNTNKIKHADEAEMFDGDVDDIFYADHADRVATNGELMSEWMAQPHILEGANFHQLAIALDRANVPKPVQKLMRKLARKEEIDDEALQSAKKSTHFGLQIKSNARRLREGAGANNFGNWLSPDDGAGFHEKHASEMAELVQPIHRMLNALPDAGGFAKRWAQRNKFWGQVSQPASHNRIVAALRRGNIATLSSEEYAVAAHLQQAFQKELKRLRDSGVNIGEIKNYFPQVWDKDLIEADPNKFRSKIFQYIKRDAVREGAAITDAEAEAATNSIYRSLMDENGVYLPANVAKKGGKSDHEYQRMLRFTAEDLDGLELEEFMVNDLAGISIKYFDQMSRKRQLAKKWGYDDHGYEAYKIVAVQGKRGIVDLLMSPKVLKVERYIPSVDGMETVAIESDKILPLLPLTKNPVEAGKIVDRLTELMSKEAVSKRQVLDELLKLHPNVTLDWRIRAEAIVEGMYDFGVSGRAVHSDELHWMDNLMKTTQRRPFLTDPFQHSASKFSKRMRNFQSVTLLGYTTLTSIPDIALPAIRSGNLPATIKAWKKYAQDPSYREAMRNIGVSIEGVLHNRIAHIYGASGGRGVNAFFNATLLSPWTQLQREVSGLVAFEAFKAEQNAAIKAISKGKKGVRYRTAMRFLKHYGLEHYAELSAPTLNDVKAFQDDDQIRWAINKFVNETIFAPSAEQIPLWAQTPWGSLAFQLKSFPMMFGRLSKHAVKEFGHGNVTPALNMLTVGAGLGMGALAIKDVVQMRGGEDEKSADTRDRKLSNFIEAAESLGQPVDKALGWYLDGFMAMGGLGLMGELVFNTAASIDNGIWGHQRIASQIAGPSFGSAFDAMNVASGVVDAAVGDGGSNSKERSAARTAVSRVPLVGGNRFLRETLTDTIAGKAEEKGGGSTGGYKSGGYKGGGYK